MSTTETVTNVGTFTGVTSPIDCLASFLAHDTRDYVLYMSSFDVRSGIMEYSLVLADDVRFSLTQFSCSGHLSVYDITFTPSYFGGNVPFTASGSLDGEIIGTDGAEVVDIDSDFSGSYRVPCWNLTYMYEDLTSDYVVIDTDYSGTFHACFSSIGSFPDLRGGDEYHVSAFYSLFVCFCIVLCLCRVAFRR